MYSNCSSVITGSYVEALTSRSYPEVSAVVVPRPPISVFGSDASHKLFTHQTAGALLNDGVKHNLVDKKNLLGGCGTYYVWVTALDGCYYYWIGACFNDYYMWFFVIIFFVMVGTFYLLIQWLVDKVHAKEARRHYNLHSKHFSSHPKTPHDMNRYRPINQDDDWDDDPDFAP